MYIILTSLYGLQQIGIWYFWVRVSLIEKCLFYLIFVCFFSSLKMYRFSRKRTKPQALLMLCSLLMFIVVAINVFVYLLIPQYAIYGDQHYSSISNVCLYDFIEKKKCLD